MRDLPALVEAAIADAEAQGFDHSCRPEHGRLLALLAAGRSGQRVGETGTGHGVGLAFMVSAAGPSTSFVSVELDAQRAASSTVLFAAHPQVAVVHGDWTSLREHGPFDLLVLDGGGKGKDLAVDSRIDPADGWLNIGGALVLDDFVPAGEPGCEEHDDARQHWLTHPLLRSTELRLAPDLATIVGVRWR